MDRVAIAVDVESGDFGPQVILSGIIEARRTSKYPFKVFICGNERRTGKLIESLGGSQLLGDYEVVTCNDFIDPGENRASVWKKQTETSIIRCITLQRELRVDASISAGDTAILLGAALFILGRSEGVLRPALAAFLPTVTKNPVLLLDVGANLNCRSEHLASFARMGEQYFSRFLKLESPGVSLLNIGKEAVKGTKTIFEAEERVRNECGNYTGFIEGNEVLSGNADVVVCDGFCGNVLLKAFESFHQLAKAVLGEPVESDPVLKKKMMILDPEIYGGVPFLGIQGTVFKAHGRSSSRAIAYAINAAVTAVKRNAVGTTLRPKGDL
jgi:glycerol-3-phosphate acyltransferase PlsX